MAQEFKINLAALRKSDEFIVDILETSAQVALYKFDPVGQEWKKTEVEGIFFLYQRSTTPKFALMIMNRLSRENFNEYVCKEMDFKVQQPFLLYKNSSMDILGIWFNNAEECTKIGQAITNLYKSPLSVIENDKRGSSIMDLFVNAQKKFDENSKLQNGICESSSSCAKSYKQKTTSLPKTSPTFSLPAAVENEDGEALHDPCIVKSSPLRTSSSVLSQSLPIHFKTTTQRELFAQYESSSSNHFPGEKVPLPSVSPFTTKVSPNIPDSVKTRSNNDLGTPPLLSPMAFKTSKAQSQQVKETNANMPVLSKDQLQGVLISLLEKGFVGHFSCQNDSDFMEKIHVAYMKNLNR
ncbi:mRNA-decapping enzyme 1B-like [Xenia sp. Carnegie-2017]|uniref:mRNA-decapping enzyme 1B-like n=1 Tax=Xenia sp. Carnegie-2017 TaxID=2897299 RepID=UPI001F03E91B|nr:mRNA-decapping enzyme 1B-like [Xenia sp. Carnegie-2017]